MGPRYLRIVVTRRCPMACSYCHHEGVKSAERALDTTSMIALVAAGIDNGVRKIKLLGGEPLVRADLPALVRGIRAVSASVDISIITSGAAPTHRIDELFDAGLDRANMSIHGWSPEAFLARGGKPGLLGLRDAMLARLVERGRPLKLNFVYRGPEDETDLDGLLTWAAGRPLVVNVLDDLGNLSLGAPDLVRAVTRLRGPAASSRIAPDPDSLSTTHLAWKDGLVVEVKHQRLGALAPWSACAGCPVRERCREGIHAVRLTEDGVLRPCMDRTDLGVSLVPALLAGGRDAAAAAWADWIALAEVRRAA